MSQQDRFQLARRHLNQMYRNAPYQDKGSWLAHNLGILEGLVARLATQDFQLMRELEARAKYPSRR